jgi:hypothetical protein
LRISYKNRRKTIMATYDVAHINEQGIDLIIIVVDSSFGLKTSGEQQKITVALQECAAAAGLVGTVVPVWDAGAGQMGFFAPTNWRPFFSSIDLAFVLANINGELTCA